MENNDISIDERYMTTNEAINLRESLRGMVESYDMLMEMPLPMAVKEVIRVTFIVEISRARHLLVVE